MEMKHEVTIRVSVDDSYSAITTQEGFAGWWTTDTEVDNDEFTFGFYNKYWMKFRKISSERNRKVEYKCIDADKVSKDWIGTKLIFNLESDGELTKIKLNHANWKEGIEIFAMCNSTWGHLMFSLKDYLEKGEGKPMS